MAPIPGGWAGPATRRHRAGDLRDAVGPGRQRPGPAEARGKHKKPETRPSSHASGSRACKVYVKPTHSTGHFVETAGDMGVI